MSRTGSERQCPHCDGTGRGPQRGAWGAILTQTGRIPAECQNCGGTGKITIRLCNACLGEFVPREEDQQRCLACTYLSSVGELR